MVLGVVPVVARVAVARLDAGAVGIPLTQGALLARVRGRGRGRVRVRYTRSLPQATLLARLRGRGRIRVRAMARARLG